MHYKIDEPIFTSLISDVSNFRPKQNSLYITGISVEERSEHTKEWESKCSHVNFARLINENSSSAVFSINNKDVTIKLRSNNEIERFLDETKHSNIYLDITGLPHHIWAPFLRVLRNKTQPIYCVYVEPGDYRFSENPTETTIFDLSEKIEGIAPLPGFVTLSAMGDEESIFVPLLGFEGARFAYMLETVQPDRTHIFPIIGVPGFRAEYPFYAYQGNRLQLMETKSWQNIRFSPANCPFSLYYVLTEISSHHSERQLRIAPIGTKPHALGAVLYYLDHPNVTEIIYDHPVRKEKRTYGTSRICIYDLSLLPPIRPMRGRDIIV